MSQEIIYRDSNKFTPMSSRGRDAKPPRFACKISQKRKKFAVNYWQPRQSVLNYQ